MSDQKPRLDWDEFTRLGAEIAQWGADYHRGLAERPVRAPLTPGAVAARFPKSPPEQGEGLDGILAELDEKIVPGLTHWQHPRFFAYFPSNATPPSMLADFVASIVAQQCMLWQTSPAGTEVETLMLDWLRQGLGLPEGFHGVIQDSASSATLAAVLTMRERALNWAGNREGLPGQARVRVYASNEVHTSVDRAIWVAGIGAENLVRIPTQGPLRAMDPGALKAAIAADRAAGYLPAGVVACTGGTGTGACDDLRDVLAVARDEGLYSHVDAAWAGAAMICPEFRTLWEGVELADSVVLNPHKWMGVQFDFSAHYLRDPEPLVKTLAIQPEYLKTHGKDGFVNYSEWSVPLGRRFRALKLWFVLKAYGLEGLRAVLRDHVTWSQALAEVLREDARFEIVTEPVLSLFTFALKGADDAAMIDFVNRVNEDGRIYVTQGKTAGRIVVRFTVGSFACTEADVVLAGDVLKELAG
ncbi:pyridoxal phosphate-dependent decarboxylase family protein [Pararhodobacter zhoushanensis]|uniref:pyridoxal phosphate-dependent decarboxylase family protein n=1 Tax=Pararhodobacter zhoushanensis TaxID=2479545 RepID=UPI000F8D9996|nr:pyridoxal-dependent decarboxylase [Pararhodobacter zhoushanensis]